MFKHIRQEKMWPLLDLSRASVSLAVITIVLFFVSSGVRFASAGHDDSFIFLWSGKSFSLGHWFVNYNDIPEEISSSIFTAWMAGLGYLFVPAAPLLFLKICGAIASTLVLCLIWQKREALFASSAPTYFVLTAVALIAISPMVEYWAWGGMETPFQSLFLLLVPIAFAKFQTEKSCSRGIWFALFLILTALNRTEGFIYVLTMAALTLLALRRGGIENGRLVRSVWPIALAIAITAAVFLTRIYFTGGAWPNPTYAKVGGPFAQLQWGLQYINAYYFTTGVIVWPQMVAVAYAAVRSISNVFRRAGATRASTHELTLDAICAIVVVHEAFVVFAGGNYMEYSRFLVPTIALKVVLIVHLLVGLRDKLELRSEISGKIAMPIVVILMVFSSAYQQVYCQRMEYNSCWTPITSFTWEKSLLASLEREIIAHNCLQNMDAVDMLPFIREGLTKYATIAGQVRLLSSQAGFVPYHIREVLSAKQFYFIDSHGLASREIAVVSAAKRSDGLVGGDRMDYVLSGRAGTLSRVVLNLKPNMVYERQVSDDCRRALEAMGFRVIWERPQAIVFFRQLD